jgi:hypothetical protein
MESAASLRSSIGQRDDTIKQQDLKYFLSFEFNGNVKKISLFTFQISINFKKTGNSF